MCTRRGYAASVSQLALATAALYFKLFKLHSRVKRSVAQPQTIYSEFPYGNIRQEALDRSGYFEYNVMVSGVWRSLVSRLVRVQEASGSNPDTPTKRRPSERMAFFFFVIIASFQRAFWRKRRFPGENLHFLEVCYNMVNFI